ncbi:MAG: DUF1573 domain-containing protein [Muribaculaceae bacterium]|nr:DUF1573 domain-containing protein [Muribaculaceae bacterium]
MRWLRTYCIMALLLPFMAASGQCLEFNDTICDLGRVTVDSGYQQCRFEFTNVSDGDVSIIGALSSCGCTIPSYPKQPIAPGEKGVVTVTYDTAGRPAGIIDKTITLVTTGEPRHIKLYIQGEAFSLRNTFR